MREKPEKIYSFQKKRKPPGGLWAVGRSASAAHVPRVHHFTPLVFLLTSALRANRRSLKIHLRVVLLVAERY